MSSVPDNTLPQQEPETRRWQSVFILMLRRDLLLCLRSKSAWLNPLIFIFIVIALFALGVGPAANDLALSAPGIVWVIALLAILLSLDSLFKSDFEDGSLEQLFLSPQSHYLAVLAKIIAHWLLTGLPIVIAAPVFSAMLYIPAHAIAYLCLGLFIGSGILTFIGAMGAALTVSLRNNQLLMALVVLPLYVPVIIFGSQMIQSAINGWEILATLAMLVGLLLFFVALAPLAVVFALRLGLDN